MCTTAPIRYTWVWKASFRSSLPSAIVCGYEISVFIILSNLFLLAFCYTFYSCSIKIIIFFSTPFKIFCSVVCLDFIFMVYDKSAFITIAEMQSNQSMHSIFITLSIFVQHYIEIACIYQILI